MPLESWAHEATFALDLFTLLATTVASVFSTIAALGFRGTPWGRTLAPLPVVFVALTVSTTVTIHPATPPHGGWVASVCWLVAVAAIAATCWRFVSLTAELEVSA